MTSSDYEKYPKTFGYYHCVITFVAAVLPYNVLFSLVDFDLLLLEACIKYPLIIFSPFYFVRLIKRKVLLDNTPALHTDATHHKTSYHQHRIGILLSFLAKRWYGKLCVCERTKAAFTVIHPVSLLTSESLLLSCHCINKYPYSLLPPKAYILKINDICFIINNV